MIMVQHFPDSKLPYKESVLESLLPEPRVKQLYSEIVRPKPSLIVIENPKHAKKNLDSNDFLVQMTG
jgi:hypothetical protein